MRARIGTLLVVAAAILVVTAEASVAASGQEAEQTAAELVVTAHQGKLLRTTADIYRVQVVDESICKVIQITPRELSVVGQSAGVTDLRVWLRDGRHRPVPLRVRVVAD